MPRCHNCSSDKKPCYYTGKENNPRGLGYCAAHEKPGQRRKGRDGHMYVVKNGKRWYKILSERSKKTSPRGEANMDTILGLIEIYSGTSHIDSVSWSDKLSNTFDVHDGGKKVEGA